MILVVVVSQINISRTREEPINFKPPNSLPGTNQPFSLFPKTHSTPEYRRKFRPTASQVFQVAPTLTLLHCQYGGNFIHPPVKKAFPRNAAAWKGLIGSDACGGKGGCVCAHLFLTVGWPPPPCVTRVASHEVCCCCGSGWKIVQISNCD